MVAQLHRHHAVAVHHGFGYLNRIGKERLEIRVGARAVDQQAEIEIGSRLGDRRRRPLLGQIDRQRACDHPAVLVDSRGHFVELALTPCQHYDVDSSLGNALGEGSPDTLGSPGDQSPRSVLLGERHGICGHTFCTVETRTGVNRRRAICQAPAVRTSSSS